MSSRRVALLELDVLEIDVLQQWATKARCQAQAFGKCMFSIGVHMQKFRNAALYVKFIQKCQFRIPSAEIVSPPEENKRLPHSCIWMPVVSRHKPTLFKNSIHVSNAEVSKLINLESHKLNNTLKPTTQQQPFPSKNNSFKCTARVSIFIGF